MKKILIIIPVFIFLLSCYDGSPLDPAKGIDSQGNTTLFSGKVHNSAGAGIAGEIVICTYVDYSGTTERWRVTTDADGKYFKRDDLSDLYSSDEIKLVVQSTPATEVTITGDNELDYDGDRESYFDPVIIRNFEL